MKDIHQVLVSLGLSEKEAVTYLALLKLGEATAYQVAQHNGLKKPTTYVVLESLLEKGFVLKIPDAKKWRFVAKKPEEIYSHEAENLASFQAFLPILSRMTSSRGTGSTDVLVFDGLNNIKRGLWYGMQDVKEFVAFYGAATGASDELLKVILDWNAELAGRGVRSRAIVPDHPSLARFRKLDDAHNRAVRVIPFSSYPSDISIEIYATFVRIFLINRPQCIIIHNPSLTKVLKNIFEIVWGATSL